MPFANGEYDHENANEHFIYGCETYKEWLEDLPTADVAKVKHGHWKHLTLEPDDITGHTYGECSICGKRRIVDNYCPNCGARMDEIE